MRILASLSAPIPMSATLWPISRHAARQSIFAEQERVTE